MSKKKPLLDSLFDKVAGLKVFLLKKTLVKVLFCEICEFLKKIFFYTTPLVAASLACDLFQNVLLLNVSYSMEL